MSLNTSNYDPTRCLNCLEKLEENDAYCHTCGQRNRAIKLGIIEWIQEGLSTFLHLEGKTWNTIRDLFIPGKLGVNYLNGQRQKYVHPFRLVVLSSLICFAGIRLNQDDATFFSISENSASNSVNLSLSTPTEDSSKAAHLAPTVEVSESKEAISSRQSTSDSTLLASEAALIKDKMLLVDVTRMNLLVNYQLDKLEDSLNNKGDLNNELLRSFSEGIRNEFKQGDSGMSLGLLNDQKLSISNKDYALLSGKEIIEKYQIKGWLSRLAGQKIISLMQSGVDNFYRYLFGNLSWVILILIPILTLGYKVFYWIKLPYYTQNLIYVSILMSVVLLSIAFAEIVRYSGGGFWIYGPIFLILWIYAISSETKIYSSKMLPTLVKNIGLLFYGFISLLIAFLIWLFIIVLLS